MCTEDAFDYQILKLTDEFYQAYPDPPYREILHKPTRAYACLLIQSKYGYFIAIPYRSEISHKYAFKFRKSNRSKKHKSGLDYTKAVVISNREFISSFSALVDKDEYMETRDNIETIKNEINEFIDDYINYQCERSSLSKNEFDRRYRFSPLQYFHDILLAESD